MPSDRGLPTAPGRQEREHQHRLLAHPVPPTRRDRRALCRRQPRPERPRDEQIGRVRSSLPQPRHASDRARNRPEPADRQQPADQPERHQPDELKQVAPRRDGEVPFRRVSRFRWATSRHGASWFRGRQSNRATSPNYHQLPQGAPSMPFIRLSRSSASRVVARLEGLSQYASAQRAKVAVPPATLSSGIDQDGHGRRRRRDQAICWEDQSHRRTHTRRAVDLEATAVQLDP